MGRGGLVVVILAGACRAPPEAPTELNDLSRYLYREWAAADPAVVAVGLQNLEAALSEVDLVGDAFERSWELEDLTEDDIAGVDHPERDPGGCLGLAVAFESRWPGVDHARVQIQPDQTPFEPTASEHYDRSFPGTPEPECFLDRSCEVLDTFNEATRKNILMTLTFELLKDIRWIELEDGRWAFVSRSWYEQPWEGDDGKVTVWQSYSLDVWLDQGDGNTWRYQSLWSETEGIPVADGTVLATVRVATDQFFHACDDAIGTEFHGEDP